jgi:MFS family permease
VGQDASDAALSTRLPVPGYQGAELTVAMDEGYVRKLFEEMTLDLLVVAVVTLFVSLELLYFLAGGIVADIAALRERAAALARGAFHAMPTSRWLASAWSTAMAARAAAISLQYQTAKETLRSAIQQRHVRPPSDNPKPSAALRQSIASWRSMRRQFSFAESGLAGRPGSTRSATLVLGALRAPFFLLLLADDLSRSFIPLFAAGLAMGPLTVSPNLVASLPIFTFMLVVALSQPVLGGWSERIGRRKSFLAGAVLAVCGHVLSAQATTLLGLLAWRAAGGAAWAIAFVAVQGYVLDHTDSKTRTAGLAAFVGIIMVSMVCGPPIGGILADGLGYRATLVVAGALTVAALLLAWRRLPVEDGASLRPAQVAALASGMPSAAPVAGPSLGLVFTNRRFLWLLLLAAVPAKVILIAYCFYLIPLYVVGVGSSPAMAGRLIMLYSVVMVLLVPVMANWVVTLRARHHSAPEAGFVATGLALSGLAGLMMALPLGLVSPLLVVLLLGMAQALSISPQAAMVAHLCQPEIARLGQSGVYGVYRMVERFGNALGPLIAAALLEIAGFQTAFVAIGLGVLMCALLFALVFLRAPSRNTSRTSPEAPVLKGVG